ncbi:MAG TPA: OmpH family outer membrane protein [Verrucomicrobiae bacterium]|jgi:outer membrane protein|nr:OmpH family outer membrane protein [Verrucomicrobiae bacterium]
MKIRIVHALFACLFLALTVAPASSAVDLADVGYLDQTMIGSLPAFQSANAQLAAYKSQLDGQFASQMKKAKNDADRQRISMQFDQQFSDKKNEVINPLLQRAQLAIAQVASSHNLSVVVDKRIVVFGGQDISKEVIDLLVSSQAIAPPASTPTTSEIGFVDQTVLDDLPKVKDANDQLSKFVAAQRDAYRGKYAQAKTDADRKAVADAYNKTVSDKQDALLKPLVDQTKSVTADAAKKKNLLLVIDRADVIYGGTDITKDVQDALSK